MMLIFLLAQDSLLEPPRHREWATQQTEHCQEEQRPRNSIRTLMQETFYYDYTALLKIPHSDLSGPLQH